MKPQIVRNYDVSINPSKTTYSRLNDEINEAKFVTEGAEAKLVLPNSPNDRCWKPALGGHEGGQFDGATAQGILQALTLIEISRCPAIPIAL